MPNHGADHCVQKNMEEEDIKYFNHQKENRNPVFLERFPDVDFKDKTVLDLGCGHGALSIDIAQKGVKEIIGIDINCELITFANEYLQKNFNELKNTVSFNCTSINELPDDHFDIIISKASFEHFIDLELLMKDIRNKLRIGGKLITGFGPLYNSPWGDHNRLKHIFPWSHITKEKKLIRKLNTKHNKNVNTIHDLGLNGYSLKKYIETFNDTEGMSVTNFRTNVSDKFSMKLFNIFTYIPFLKEYFTYNIYCILERKY